QGGARLGRGGLALLAGADARGRRGPAVPRPPSRAHGRRRCRARRPPGPHGGAGGEGRLPLPGKPRRRARAGGGDGVSRHRSQVEPRVRGVRAGDGRRGRAPHRPGTAPHPQRAHEADGRAGLRRRVQVRARLRGRLCAAGLPAGGAARREVVRTPHVPQPLHAHGGGRRPRGDPLRHRPARAAARPLAGEPQPRDRAHPLRVGGDGRRGAGALDEAGGGLRARGEGDPGYAARRRDGGAEGQRQRPAADAGQVTRQLIDIQPPVERAFLVGAPRKGTAEAKMEVELAQLEYLLPRLTRMWTHLSRIRGGIGLRGPGETQLETDRRAIRRKISVLKRRLEDVAHHRANQRLGRRECPSAALVGYTNAGKSSILRALTGDDIFVEDRLFATLDTLTRELDVGEGYRFRLSDTVGFIRKLPHHLVASFRATLEEARAADLLLHVIDAAAPNWEEQMEVVDREMRNAERGTRNESGSVERKRVIY